MDNITENLQTTGKERKMDTLERFYIFRETKINNQINDKLTIKPNNIFETIVHEDPHRGLPAAYRHLKNST
jgi:effector-binding domain-containing protein